MPKTSTYKVSLFSQGYDSKRKGGIGEDNKRGGDNKTFDKHYWQDKDCYKCGDQVHQSYHCTTVKKHKDGYDKSMKNNSSRASVKNIAKDIKKISKSFTTVKTWLQKLKEAEYNLSDSEE